jgi:hypothetical protein
VFTLIAADRYVLKDDFLVKAFADHKRVYRYMLRIAEQRHTRICAKNPNCEEINEEDLSPEEWLDEEDEQTGLFGGLMS